MMSDNKPPVEIKIEPIDTDLEDDSLNRLDGKMRSDQMVKIEQVKIEPYEIDEEPHSISIKVEDGFYSDEIEQSPNLLVPKRVQKVEISYCPDEIIKKTDKPSESPDPNQCNICFKRYRSKKGVSTHEKKAHVNKVINQGESVCPVCKKKYSNKKSLHTHLVSMHLKNMGEGKKFSCKICDRIFNNRSALWTHNLHKHSDVDLSRVCPHCGKRLKTSRSLREHTQKLHPSEYLGGGRDREQAERITRPFQCAACDKRFTNKCVLKKHVKIVHSAEVFECDHCGKSFRSRQQIESHLMCVHSNLSDTITCLICFKVVKNRIAFKCHMKLVHKGDPRLDECRPSTLEEAVLYKRQANPERILP